LIKAVYSVNPSASRAAAEIKDKLAGFDVSMLIYFASWQIYEPNEISSCMQDAFPGTVCFGCSSQAEISGSKTLNDSVSAMAFTTETVPDAKIFVLENVSRGFDINAAFDAFEAHFGVSMAEMDYKKYCGIILIDGFSQKEVDVMEKIGSHTNIMFIGGSASDNLAFSGSFVYANGKSYGDAALLCVFKAGTKVSFIKTQSVDVRDETLLVTKCDKNARTVFEFDNKPAASRYGEILGVLPDKIEDVFFAHPLGLVIDSDAYIRTCRAGENGAMTFTVNMPKGMRLNMLQIRDIIPDTKAAVENKRAELGEIKGVIDFRCGYRTIQLKNEGKTEHYGKIFDGIETAGFSTYGEQCYGHMNHTSVMLVFG